MQDRVELPACPKVTLVGDRVQAIPMDGETLLVSETVPVNPRVAVTIIVEAPLAPAFTMTLDELTSSAKSCTVTANEAECASEPLVPEAITV